MKKRLFSFLQPLKVFSFFVPFTVYFGAFSVALLVLWQTLRSNTVEPTSSFAAVFGLLLKVTATFTVVLLLTTLLLVLVSWIYFFYQKKQGAVSISVHVSSHEHAQGDRQEVHLQLKPILKPLLGFVKIRFQYDEQHFSEKFSLLQSRKTVGNASSARSLDGKYYWTLPSIKEYTFRRAFVYFEDVFQFFSFTITIPYNNTFFAAPSDKELSASTIAPRKTETTTTRIDQMRRVEGEMLNYKNFEDSDDVRRIVWKIYAKNKELVVRIPEVMDPYASHLYVYASFFSQFNVSGNDTLAIPFLNYYKNMIWSAYQSLVKQGFDVRYIPDQDVVRSSHGKDEQQWVKYAISASQWHSGKALKEIVNTKDAALVIVSSLTDADELKQLMDQHGSIRYLFVKLSDCFGQQQVIDWLQWVFVNAAPQDIDVYKRQWALPLPLHRSIKANEKRLEQLLNAQGAPMSR